MAFNSQDGIKQYAANKKVDYSTDNMFAGMWRLDQSNLDRFDPFISGYGYIIWTKLPLFFNPTIKTQFQALTERNFKAFDGIADINLAVEDLTHGFTGNALGVATNINKENTSFTLRHYELQGSPIREMYQHWVTGIRDPETGLAHYHGKISELGYSMKNHTGELLYVLTDPSGAKNGIEFAAYYTNVFPTKIPMGHLNYASGEHGLNEIDIEFRGNLHLGAKVNKLAIEAMEYYQIKKQYGEYELNSKGRIDFSSNNAYNEDATY